MRAYSRLGLAAAAALLFGLTTAAQAKALVMAGPQTPAAQAANADAIIVGKITEVENDSIEVSPYKGAPKDQKVSFKVAVLKVDEALLGGSGLTRFRVGFPADAAPAVAPPGSEAPPVPVRPGLGRVRRPGMAAPVALAAGMEGCFFLTRHPDGDFYVITSGAPLLKKDEKFAKELEQVRKVVKAIDDPVAALKAKELGDRFQAAQVILQRYQTPRGGSTAREPVPEEENKLLVALLMELPWMPKDGATARPGGEVAPSRSALWYLVNPAESGFKQPQPQPQRPGDPPVDFNRVMDEATSKFLKDSGDKIKIKRFAPK
jgi:hypothetical protein